MRKLILTFMLVQICQEVKTVPCQPMPHDTTYYIAPLCFESRLISTVLKRGLKKEQAEYGVLLLTHPGSCKFEARTESNKIIRK